MWTCWCSVQNTLQLLDVLLILTSRNIAANSLQYYCFPLSSCLRSWLEQDTSCPTCRMSLNITDSHHVREDHQRENLEENLGPVAVAEGRPRLNQHNHFFHFDGELGTFDILCCCPNKRREQHCVGVNSVHVSYCSFVSEVVQSYRDFLKDFVPISASFFLRFVQVNSFTTGIYPLHALLTNRMGNSCVLFCHQVAG